MSFSRNPDIQTTGITLMSRDSCLFAKLYIIVNSIMERRLKFFDT